MRVTVILWAHLRDAAGASRLVIDMPAGSTCGDAVRRLLTDHPALMSWDRSLLLAVGDEFSPRERVLRENDELSLMPPVQGG